MYHMDTILSKYKYNYNISDIFFCYIIAAPGTVGPGMYGFILRNII